MRSSENPAQPKEKKKKADSDSVDLEWGLKFCISSGLSDDAHAAGNAVPMASGHGGLWRTPPHGPHVYRVSLYTWLAGQVHVFGSYGP